MGNKNKANGRTLTTASSTGATATATTSFVRRSRRDAPTPNRQRGESDEEYETSAEVDPEVLVDSLLACLIKNENLLNGFIVDLFQIPKIPDKIVTGDGGAKEHPIRKCCKPVCQSCNK